MVAARLAAEGHSVAAVDLPGREGSARGDVTMADHVAAVRAAIEAAGPEPVTLVGHSFGGMVISAVAEAAPERIATLVYVAAYLPQDGDSMQALAESDHHNGFRDGSFVVAGDYSSASILERDRVAIFAPTRRPTSARPSRPTCAPSRSPRWARRWRSAPSASAPCARAMLSRCATMRSRRGCNSA